MIATTQNAGLQSIRTQLKQCCDQLVMSALGAREQWQWIAGCLLSCSSV